MSVDIILVQVVNKLAQTSPVLTAMVIVCASVLIWALVVWYVIAFVWHKRGGWRELCALALGTFMVFFTNILASVWWFRPRPFVLGITEKLITVDPATKSFPSDHAAVAFFLAYLLSSHNPRWRIPAYLGAVLVAFGRMAVGVHFPSDVLAGAVVGVAFGYLTMEVERLFTSPKVQ